MTKKISNIPTNERGGTRRTQNMQLPAFQNIKKGTFFKDFDFPNVLQWILSKHNLQIMAVQHNIPFSLETVSSKQLIQAPARFDVINSLGFIFGSDFFIYLLSSELFTTISLNFRWSLTVSLNVRKICIESGGTHCMALLFRFKNWGFMRG